MHKAKPGHPKWGGRQKGTPNKNSLDFPKRLAEIGLDVVAEISLILMDTSPTALSKKDKVSVLVQMLNYIYPTRKALSLSPEDEARLAKLRQYEQMAQKDLERVINNAIGSTDHSASDQGEAQYS